MAKSFSSIMKKLGITNILIIIVAIVVILCCYMLINKSREGFTQQDNSQAILNFLMDIDPEGFNNYKN